MVGYTNKVKLGTSSAFAVYADSSPAPIADPDDRAGWLFQKTIPGPDKFNYYFYGEGSQPFTVSQLNAMSAVIRVDNWQGISSTPFFAVYTKATGVNDAGAWYHSRRTYMMDLPRTVLLGERFCGWSLKEPESNGIRKISFQRTSTVGDYAPSEEILTISFGSDSNAPQNTQILVESLDLELSGIATSLELSA